MTSSSFFRSFNQLSGSSSNARSQIPHKINFTAEGNGWRQGHTEAWYQEHRASGRSTFTSLEYHREREAPFYHEFIVVDLGNTVCRFDRRGDFNNRANVLIGDPITSEDTAHIIAKTDNENYDQIKDLSDILLTMKFPQGQDLLKILAICYGIQVNRNTHSFRLTHYNCYFFAWMIVLAIARSSVDWALVAKDSSLWQELVQSVMSSLDLDPGPAPMVTIPATSLLKRRDDALVPNRFIGSTRLIDSLRRALRETRKQIEVSLSGTIILSTINNEMRQVTRTSAQQAAAQVARNHSRQAARDVAMETVIEVMWRDLVQGSEGGKVWRRICQLVEECVQKASTTAAAVAERLHYPELPPIEPQVSESGAALAASKASGGGLGPIPTSEWEAAWDTTWEESWAAQNVSGGPLASNTNDFSKSTISARAKAAWIREWEEVSQAAEQYVPSISSATVDYIMKSLPETTPEVFTFETGENLSTRKVKGLIPTKGSSNAELQEWVMGRVVAHCQRVYRVTAGARQPNKAEFQEAMKDVWKLSLSCLL